MDLNTIEKQLTDKSIGDIRKCAQEIVHVLKAFSKDKTGKIRNGIHWPVNRDYSSRTDSYTYRYSHLDYHKLEKIIIESIQNDLLDDIVKKKTTDLLSKLELLD